MPEAYEFQAEVDRIVVATKALQGSVPADYRRGGNCGVLSVAICAGVSFEKAWAACRMRKGSKGGTTSYQRRQALIALRVKIEERAMRSYHTSTMRTFVRDFTVPGATYMITMHGHCVTVRDGIVIDQNGASPAATHWTKNKRVKSSWRIL
jgi:hypothetical protein